MTILTYYMDDGNNSGLLSHFVGINPQKVSFAQLYVLSDIECTCIEAAQTFP